MNQNNKNNPALTYLYIFENSDKVLIEVKRNDFDESIVKDPNRIFHWLLISKTDFKISRFNFKSSAKSGVMEIREFEQGILKMREEKCDLLLSTGEKIQLEKISGISEDIELKIYEFFRIVPTKNN